ncbi:hypothetical protein C0995_015857 [Termitomyces sp. Mi166|nr:hypothetical protein C0995_015857 [Termitomyces sp. Mi166\
MVSHPLTPLAFIGLLSQPGPSTASATNPKAGSTGLVCQPPMTETVTGADTTIALASMFDAPDVNTPSLNPAKNVEITPTASTVKLSSALAVREESTIAASATEKPLDWSEDIEEAMCDGMLHSSRQE